MSAFKFERASSASSEADSGSGDDQTEGGDGEPGTLQSAKLIKEPKTPTKFPLSPSKAFPKKKVRNASKSENKSSRVHHTGLRVLYTAGRPPWYNTHGELKDAFVIGVCGGSASGKTTVANRIIEELDVPWVSLLSMDSFYKVLGEKEHEAANRNEYNFDHPDAFDFELLTKTLRRLRVGKKVDVPVYNFVSHSREPQCKTIYGANVVIFEGIMAFTNKDLLPLMDLKVFVDTDSDIRLARRMKRDISERGRALEGVLKQYNKFVKPAFEHWIAPTMSCADIIVPRGGENRVAIDLIVRHVHTQLNKRGFCLRQIMANAGNNGHPPPSSLQVLQTTPQVRGIHTFIRNKETARDEFIFYSKRLMRLLFEYAMNFLPHKKVSIETVQGVPYEGYRLDTKKIVGVSILRAGETMEQALCEVYKDITIGKILIQTNLDTGEPELHYLRLPKDIKESHVMLMDATVATGAAAMMAIRVLLDHDVQEENIILLSMLMGDSGVHSIAYAFPKVKLVTTAVDKEVNEKFHIVPGIGNFGDRYFGTDYYEKEELS
ncbi:uridine-cytidine kinase-like 1 isoform X2 [Ruditapes philippinarum]|uniref:uridine-cytidine kinase-like 1 isoform X2 n=1 Tax=Ruditapes philippinarum TaxID=129788 RepID=UPI00295B5C3B|nr:uridine-cytidine kinase-like 1 isoform X2 [Ruditapes philippinarum]